MNMSIAAATATALLLVLIVVPAAVAVTHKVGDASGWASGVDYEDWVKGKTFTIGDTLEFTYGPSHSVVEVNKAGYDGCGGTPIDSHSGGDTKIDLDKVGPRYFYCPTSGHCLGGQKVAVTVTAASTPGTPSTPATPSPPASTPGTPSTPETPPATGTPATPTPDAGSSTSPPPPPPPPPKGSATKGLVSYVLVGVSMVLGYGLIM